MFSEVSSHWGIFFLALLLMSAMADCSWKISREPRPPRREPNTSVCTLPICTRSQGAHVPTRGTEKREERDKDKSVIQCKDVTQIQVACYCNMLERLKNTQHGVVFSYASSGVRDSNLSGTAVHRGRCGGNNGGRRWWISPGASAGCQHCHARLPICESLSGGDFRVDFKNATRQRLRWDRWWFVLYQLNPTSQATTIVNSELSS